MNPADLVSRGIQAHEVEKWRFYHEGPDFLKRPEREWPQMKIDLSAKESVVIKAVEVREETEEERRLGWWYEEISGISTWMRKVGVMATVMKVAKMWTAKLRMRRGRTRTKELERISKMRNDLRVLSERELLKSIQRKHFLSERRELEEKGISVPNGRK